MDSKTNLVKLIEREAVLRGTFKLRSGKISSWYVDKYCLTTRPQVLSAICEDLASRIHKDTDRVAGAELGGIPLVSGTSIKSGLPSVFIRNSKKAYGTEQQLEGALEEGDRVVLVEDVITTGGQAIEAAKIIESAGAVVSKILAVFDRQEGGQKSIESSGYIFESLVNKEMLGLE
tara:strand:+ start:257 stop:781 length:525 start_codon:yes stop_codon:yes gene_type:complete